jgi:hypothetical protein
VAHPFYKHAYICNCIVQILYRENNFKCYFNRHLKIFKPYFWWENGLWVFENSDLERIFGTKGKDARWKWGKLHSEELSNLYFSANIIRVLVSRRVKWAGHVAYMGDMSNAKILVNKYEVGRPLMTPRRESEHNIEMCHKNFDWTLLAPDKDLWRIFVNMVMNEEWRLLGCVAK